MYSRCAASSASTCIVRNLRIVNGRMPWPSRVWRKKTGPGESRLIRHAVKAKSGAARASPRSAPATSITRFSGRENGKRFDRREADERQALDRVDLHVRADDARRGAGRCRSGCRAREPPGRARACLVVRVAREGDDDALDVELVDELGQLARPGRGPARRPRSARSSRGSASTKPTRLIPYSRCWRNLRATSWPTSPAPTMTVFCR